jgi:hypothetical protein
MTKQTAAHAADPPALNASTNVRAECARRGRTHREVQKALGMARSTWDRRMREPRTWRLGELAAIARFLDVPLDRIADGIDR